MLPWDQQQGASVRQAGLILLVTAAAGVAANEDDGDAEFAFDLFSDIAPTLALFGEQFARQIVSESLTWIDHLVFAMVPLDILTMIAGVIRVQGPRIAKSFIGCARENRALAKIELMSSSTSGEVCELFNGRSIVRAMGKPKITQFLVFPALYDELEAKYTSFDNSHAPDRAPTATTIKPSPNKSCGIHALRTAASTVPGEPGAEPGGNRLMECVEFHSHSYEIIERFLARLKSLAHRTKLTRRKAGSVDVESPGVTGAEEHFDLQSTAQPILRSL
ncbi:hypothetical protein B0H67DRAFT_647319 [Lasiosphaeris hirsuta]|uniref:Uncharacterized protein n=1 Tax=Lasiosphaeris hirsuta TaxID=260670 RepID=A0AA40A9Z4_9PEZI|nr:hypothetical protein B0H67DRAFT_647319 [Lasiosphaeris hirsuta]